ncbi:MAG: GHKL domain-containing protein [Lachnospiraceae bacterium]|nr:GHKL domain-containing protein [Lachnospiraceae bacterium]
MAFYLRHSVGFLIQFGAGIVLCLLPFNAAAFRCSRRWLVAGSIALALVSSLMFPIAIGMESPSYVAYQPLIANMYMLGAIIVFVALYFYVLRVELIKKMVALILTLLYAAAQYLVVNFILALNPEGIRAEIYPPLTLALYAITAAVMLPVFGILMYRAVREYLAEMEMKNIRREFVVLLVVTFLYLAILMIYGSSTAGMIPTYWWWIVPPLLLATAILGIFYWSLFRESIRRKRDSEERKTLEIQKLQYESISREMENVKRMRHDMRHTLNHLSDLLEQGEEQAMQEYLADMTVQISHRETVQYCKNTTVNGLLQYYVSMAADREIRCTVRADCDELPIAPVDLTIVLGNLMENAIHSCEQTEENRWITVAIGVISGSMLIQITNPCQGVHLSGKYRQNGGFLPAEAFVSGRQGGGYGLHSLEHTAEKYGGNARFRYEEQTKTFTTRVRLNIYPATV